MNKKERIEQGYFTGREVSRMLHLSHWMWDYHRQYLPQPEQRIKGHKRRFYTARQLPTIKKYFEEHKLNAHYPDPVGM